MKNIPYTIPHFAQPERDAINDLLDNPQKIISEYYTKECRKLLNDYYQRNVLLTHSCTAALEMSAILLNIKPGDEVIIPSFTFVSTANAFALFGAKPVFVDIQKDTLNVDAAQIAAAITSKTKAIVVMHYAAISCDMPAILDIANAHNIPIIEDAAQCIGATYNERHLGTFGKLGTLSFHNTKNITSGLGGALIINDEELLSRAKIIWQKGTNREAFIEGNVDKYTWHDLGSSYMMNEFGSALLHGQLSRLDEITRRRMQIWDTYHEALAEFEFENNFRRPIIPKDCKHNAHIYYLIAPSETIAIKLRQELAEYGITTPFHYVPLHLSPAGQRFSGEKKSLPVCEDIYKRIIRLPIWEGMDSYISKVIEKIYGATLFALPQ